MYTSTLKTEYTETIRPALQKELGVKNVMQVPKIEKIVVNAGMGSYLQKMNSKDYSFVVENIERITGQKAVVKHAKLSVSNFKLREGQPVGVMVTLRGDKAYNFLAKLIHVTLPRVRDFRGIKTNIFDKSGNCSFGFPDHTVFPEGIMPEDARKTFGFQITVCTSANDEKSAKALMTSLGFPFKKLKNNPAA